MPQQEPEAQLVVFSAQGAEVTFSIKGDKDTLWGTRQQIAEAFGCTDKNVLIHIQNIYEEQELDPAATSKKSLLVQIEGGRSVKRSMDLFNLDVILAVGYRISTAKATKFRQWATKTLRQFITTGFVLDESRLANDATAQRELFKAIRALRHNEKAMYQKVRDVFKISSSDYDAHSQPAKKFFAMAQDKFHFAVTGKTAAELILERADSSKENMGLQTLKGELPTTADATVGKNYLLEKDLESLENICEQFLLFAESKAFRGQKMTWRRSRRNSIFCLPRTIIPFCTSTKRT